MGNRAIISTTKKDLMIYLHWNGGRDSVEGFLEYCKLRGFRNPVNDSYGWARMCQIIANFISSDGLSIGIMPYSEHAGECCDNGEYVINENWEIVDRIDYDGPEQMEYELIDMLESIDVNQPKDQQLGRVFINAKETPTTELRIGDYVFADDWDGQHRIGKVLGFGEFGRKVNGTDVKGKPYASFYRYGGEKFADNINNYILDDMIRKADMSISNDYD